MGDSGAGGSMVGLRNEGMGSVPRTSRRSRKLGR